MGNSNPSGNIDSVLGWNLIHKMKHNIYKGHSHSIWGKKSVRLGNTK